MNRSQRHEAIELERTTLGPLPALAGGEGPPLLYLGGLLPVAGVDPSLARRIGGVLRAPVQRTDAG